MKKIEISLTECIAIYKEEKKWEAEGGFGSDGIVKTKALEAYGETLCPTIGMVWIINEANRELASLLIEILNLDNLEKKFIDVS